MVAPCLIPEPVSVEEKVEGGFLLSERTRIGCESGLFPELSRLQERLRAASGLELPRVTELSKVSTGEGVIWLAVDPTLREEEYRLEVTPSKITVTGGSAAGVTRGCSTLVRIFPTQVYRQAPVVTAPWVVPTLTIKDWPQFSWRGLLVDVARHFQPKRELLRIIDLMGVLQLNVMHLHLTDDQGWRIEIDGYPKLTETASWRKESQQGTSDRFDGRPHGGYYTQDDLREIVAYASERHIDVMPEVDLPGHMEAAIAAYPQFGTSRKPAEVRTKWGISKNVLNLDPETVEFVEETLRQVTEIFPFEFISIGGDECPTNGWEADPGTQARKKELGIETDRDVQAWYTKLATDLLAAKGRRTMAWDEVLTGPVDDSVLIAAWRGQKAIDVALARGLDVVACPTTHCYFDYRQSESPEEPVPVGIPIDLERVYSFNPVPEGGEEPGRVLGGQANVWSEHLDSSRSFDYAAFPRLAALAEVLWSGPGGNFEEFEERLPSLLARLQVMGVDYRPLDGPLPWQKRPGVPGYFGTLEGHREWYAKQTADLVVNP